MTQRRIIQRDLITGTLKATRAAPDTLCCGRTIRLDGQVYRCEREVRPTDGQHDGIHDAFREHGDDGAVRW